MNFKEFLSSTKTILVIVKSIALIIAVISVVFAIMHFTMGVSLFGRSRGLKIDNTANVITEIKKISEFSTACFYEEFILKDEKYDYSETTVYRKVETGSAIIDMLGLGREKDGIKLDSVKVAEIAIIAKGKVRAGYRLSELTSEDIKVSSDTISIRLSEPELFDVIVNPSDLEIFNSIGNWEDEEISSIVANAKQELIVDAKEAGLLEKARKSGTEKLQDLFKSFGFNTVIIKFNR